MADLVVSANVQTMLASADFAGVRSTLSLGSLSTVTPGAGVATALAIATGSAGGVILIGGSAGTPASIVLTNASGTAANLTAGAATILATPRAINGVNFDGSAAITITANAATLTGSSLASGVSVAYTQIGGLGSGVGNFLNAPSSATLASAVTDETGTGALMFNTNPSLVVTAPASLSAGYLGIPQNSNSANYTTVLSDAGKHILHPSADTTARTFTIDSNANVAYPIGTALTFVNQNAGGVITIAITTDTMRLAGAGTTGSRTLAANGIATAIKLTSTEWLINGTGLT